MSILSCGLFRPQVENEYAHPDFTHAALASGGLMVGAVVSKVGNEDERRQHYGDWSRILWSSIDRETEGLNIMVPEHLESALGDSFPDWQNGCEGKNVLDREDLAMLQAAVGGNPNYMVMARFLNDNTSHEKEKVEDTSGTTLEVKLRTTRTVKAQVQVYNLQEGVLSWKGEFVRSKTRTKSVNKDPDRGGGFFGNILHDLLLQGGNTESHPEAPPFNEMAEFIFEDFSKTLPSGG
jgi:hypothetical protein